jgi:trk system potassium uptake protein
MKFDAVQKVLGLLLAIFSFSMLTPVVVSLIYDEGGAGPFLAAFALIFGLGLLIFLPVSRSREVLRVRDGFLVVVLFWTVLGLAGALPFWLAPNPAVSITDAVFESISGLTTTGATVIIGLDHLPKSILFYRQQLQWLGGMGIIVLAVAVLPMLGVGGMQLFRAEMPGPMKDSKLTPRITETAKALWYIYLWMTIACALAYWWAGMTVFDAIGHAFSTVAIGGFSTHDQSIGYFNSTAIELIAVTFMVLAGMSFTLHFMVVRRQDPRLYFQDSEFRLYLLVLVTVIAITTLALYESRTYATWWESFIKGIFQAVSISTTTGFATAEFYAWPPFSRSCCCWRASSAAVRVRPAAGSRSSASCCSSSRACARSERLIHPNAQIPVRIGGKTVNHRVVDAVWGFFSLYVASFILMYLMLAATGLDLVTAFSAVAACINNLGPGLATVGPHYADLNDTAKWILCFAMLLGRLEIFTLLVLLSPAFWQR